MAPTEHSGSISRSPLAVRNAFPRHTMTLVAGLFVHGIAPLPPLYAVPLGESSPKFGRGHVPASTRT
jgi:hypothetical protein